MKIIGSYNSAGTKYDNVANVSLIFVHKRPKYKRNYLDYMD